ncbi:ROK family protein [Kitasatospora sp. A2-31]|uniref:ROK family transcriptional regulator n=1 Tax=Kitasatospora sp. A2-31 TaxID=2916414 RepID=UPI001EEBFDFD|nr:ROK family protein [Kitasatospora sp. A2-31]MCG6495480.1 ROK family protein [Kitasatospora sp. A2-31]
MPDPLPRHTLRIGDDRRDVNAAAVLRTVLDHGPIARSRVAALTGLSASAVSRQVVDLSRLGLLHERPELTGTGAGAVGRPQLPVDVDTRRLAVAGLHIGVPYTTFALLDLRGNVLHRQESSNRGRKGNTLLRSLLERLPRLLAAVPGGRTVVGLGAVSGGTVDPDLGLVVRHDPLEWRDVPLGELLGRACGLPVQVDNHARALTQAEILFGHPAARRSMVQLFVGHVVDAALAVAGVVHLGPASATGDVAHLPVPDSDALCHCGRVGCLAVAASDTTLFEAAAAAGITPRADRAELIAAVRAGDPRADRLVRRRAAIVGRALALLADVVNPDLLVLTETFAVLDPAYLDVVRTEFALRSHLRRDADLLVAQRRGADALAVAAGAAALGALYARPLQATAAAPVPAGATATLALAAHARPL